MIGRFNDLTGLEVQNMVQLNTLHVIYTVKVLLNKLVQRHTERGVKSAILVTSSGLGCLPLSGFLTYSCSKSFVSFLAQGLHIELKGVVDVISYEAGEV